MAPGRELAQPSSEGEQGEPIQEGDAAVDYDAANEAPAQDADASAYDESYDYGYDGSYNSGYDEVPSYDYGYDESGYNGGYVADNAA